MHSLGVAGFRKEPHERNTQSTINVMAAKFGGRTIDGLAKKYGDGTIHIVPLKQQ
jgi:hypothetical protein